MSTQGIPEMNLAPIALFTYNRLHHTRLTIEALAANELAPESDLYVFSDAPRSEAHREAVREVREFIGSVRGFRTITLVEREENLGLARSIIDGVTRLTDERGSVIVLEDDLLTSPFFLRYMNDALTLYRDDEQVISIHGYVYPLKERVPELFFIRGADCWGWATWKRGWELFQHDGTALLAELRKRKLERAFNFDNSYPYIKMLESQVRGDNDSWAIRWNASAFLNDKLTLYPARSLVRNIGFDASGFHCGANADFDVPLSETPIMLERIEIVESAQANRAFRTFFKGIRTGFWQRQKNSIRKRINRLTRRF